MTMNASEITSLNPGMLTVLARDMPAAANSSQRSAVSADAQVTPPLANQIADQDEAASRDGTSQLQPLGGWPKRLIDLLIAGTALILAAPVMLIIALLIRMTCGGPAIFAHNRIGFNGRTFKCYKFRTMVANADQALASYLADNPQAAEEWQENRKLKNDPRVTLLGQMLRKSSLDELPQLFNVLRGDMSCVGPRPVVADELERYGPDACEYLRTRPGVTGLWQVTGRGTTDYARRVFLDSHYVRNWSVRADVAILVWTIFAVMKFNQTS